MNVSEEQTLDALVVSVATESLANGRVVFFVDDFVGSLSTRIERVQRAVDRGDLDDALAALLGLSTSSAMIGAVILSTAARDLHTEVARAHAVPGRAADLLERIGMASCVELAHLTAPWRVDA